MQGMEILVEGARELDIEIGSVEMQKFRLYAELLREWNKKFNLVRLRERDELFREHFLDSLWCCRGYDLKGVSNLLDLGSGAGFPAIPLKICFSHMHVVMVDSQGKRCRFLQEVIRVLQLENCRVAWERSESMAHDLKHRERYDCVTARALAPLNVLLELGVPFLKYGGRLIALKGHDIVRELDDAQYAMDVLGARMEKIIPYSFTGEMGRHVVTFIKEVKTPKIYPRRTGIPAKRPLRERKDNY